MSKIEKLLEKLHNIDADNSWMFDEAVYVLKRTGFEDLGGKGSHQVYQNSKTNKTIVLAKHGGKIKSGYIKQLRKVLENEK